MRSLRVQLLISHLALVVLMAAVTGSAIYSFVQLGRSADRALQDDLGTLTGASRVESALAQQREVLALLRSGARDAAAPIYGASVVDLQGGVDDIQDTATEPEETALAVSLKTETNAYAKAFDTIYRSNLEGYRPSTREATRRNLFPHTERIRKATERLREINEASILASSHQRRQDANRAIERTMIVTAIAIVLAVLLAIRQNRTAVEPLASLAERAEAIASGDFAVRETARKDEIGALGTALEAMAGRLDEARAQARRRLQKLEQMSDAALEHLYDPVVVLDGKARIAHLNRAAEDLFGTIPEGAKVPVADQIEDRRLVRALETATTGRFEATDDATALLSIKGRIYRLRANPMADETGGHLGSVAVLEDVTQMREVDRLKNEFIGVASHELRTPVASLLLGAEMLQQGAVGELNESQMQIVAMQLEDLSRLQKLMQDLLDVTKLESGSVRTNRSRVSVVDLVCPPLEGLRSQAEAKKIVLTDVGMEGGGDVFADRGQVGRVLTNLVSNAIRHTPPGGTIMVRALPAEDEVTFAVEDTGVGIPEGYLATIFDRFVQVPGATQGGAGLGLSIAGNIVRSHGGRIWAESILGQGSRFFFTIPRIAGATGGDETL